MVEPLPLKVLIHSVEYEEYDGNDRLGETYKDPITIENVLVQPVSSIERDSTGERKAYNALLFYDVIQSKPENVIFKEKSKVTFDGQTMVVGKINPVYAFSLHHYEVELK